MSTHIPMYLTTTKEKYFSNDLKDNCCIEIDKMQNCKLTQLSKQTSRMEENIYRIVKALELREIRLRKPPVEVTSHNFINAVREKQNH